MQRTANPQPGRRKTAASIPRIWVLCPNLWGARLFSYGGADQSLQDLDSVRFVREFPRPKLQTKLEDFRDDDDAADISEPVEDPAFEEKVARSFMHFLAGELERARDNNRFDKLILCAEKKLLDILQHSLGAGSRGRVVGTVPLDLYEVNETDLTPYVKDVLRSARVIGEAA